MEYGFNLTWGSEAMSEIIWVTGGLSWNAFIYNNNVPTLSSNTAVTLGSNSLRKKATFLFPIHEDCKIQIKHAFQSGTFSVFILSDMWVLLLDMAGVWRDTLSGWDMNRSQCAPSAHKNSDRIVKKRTIEIPRNPVLFLWLDAFHSSVALAEGLSLLFWPCQLFESQCCFIST